MGGLIRRPVFCCLTDGDITKWHPVCGVRFGACGIEYSTQEAA